MIQTLKICKTTRRNYRVQQLIAQQQRLRADVPGDVISKIKFGHQIFIEHAADVVSI